jgi:hypothetical protein
MAFNITSAFTAKIENHGPEVKTQTTFLAFIIPWNLM